MVSVISRSRASLRLERTGDFGIGGRGLGQPGVGGFQLVGACAHMAFQLGVLPLHQLAIEFCSVMSVYRVIKP